jgi:hypothetical protein
MKSAFSKKMLVLPLVFSLILSYFQFFSVTTISATPIPDILITEVIPNPTCSGGGTGDCYEFMEFYNNGSSSVNLQDYKIEMLSSSPTVTWNLTASMVLQPEETGIVWIRPNSGPNASLTKSNFRSHYGVTSTELPDAKILLLSLGSGVSGMPTADQQTIRLKLDSGGDAIARAIYNATDSGSVDDTRNGKSITYSYPTDATNIMRKVQSNQAPTPGKLLDDQIPNGKELLVTEMMVNPSAGIGTGDAFEYIEVYNKSFSPIDLKDYQIEYHVSDPSFTVLDLDEHLWLSPSQTSVIWLRDSANSGLTKNDFRTQYGVSSTVLPDSRLYIKDVSTPALVSGTRWVIFSKDGSNQKVMRADYDATDHGFENKSITFKYPFGTEPLKMRKVANNQTPSPGSVTAGTQLPLAAVPGRFFYYGNLHAHTGYSPDVRDKDISDCLVLDMCNDPVLDVRKSTPKDAMQFVMNNGQADFFGVTDHSHIGFEDIISGTKTRWDTAKDMADEMNDDGNFVTMFGYEMTWGSEGGRVGHMNSFLTDTYEVAKEYKPGTTEYPTLQDYFDSLKSESSYSISQFNHAGYSGDFNDFSYHDADIDPRIRLMEMQGVVEMESYQRVLDKGWHVMPSANQDNHHRNWISESQERVVVVAPRNSRHDVYEAIRKRNGYSTEDKNVQVMFTGNGELMGSILNNPGSIDLVVDVYDPNPNAGDTVASMQIMTDTGKVVSTWSGTASNSVNWSVTVDGRYSYYYAKIVQTDGGETYTAPIWTGGTTIGSTYGISKMEVTNGATKSIGATVKNPTGTALSNITVSFFKDALGPANSIGTVVLPSIPANGEARAVLTGWTAPTSGSYRLLSQAHIPVGSVNRLFPGYIEVPELLVTELLANNGAPAFDEGNLAGTTDPYEYFELYNNSGSSINLQNYRARLYNQAGHKPAAYRVYDMTTSKSLAAGGKMVVWLKTAASSGKTLSDFNTKYGTSLTSAGLYELDISGLAADQQIGFNNLTYTRVMEIRKDDDTLISSVRINRDLDVASGEDITLNKSVIYTYPKTGIKQVDKTAANQTPSPGTLSTGQVPAASLP